MIIIDGYNLIYKHVALTDDKSLIEKMQAFSHFHKKKVIIVFDGEWDYQDEYDTEYLTIYYVSDADAVIKELVLEMSNVTVISSDRDIIHFVRSKKGCQAIKSEHFMFDLPSESEYEQEWYPDVSDDDVEEYLNELGI